MVQIFKTKEERRPLFQFTSKEVGYAAAFGGLGFAMRALGIWVPVMGPWGAEPRDIINFVGPAFSGPLIGAYIQGFIDGLASGIPDFWLVGFWCLFAGLAFNYFKRPWYYLALCFDLFIFIPLAWGTYMQVLGLMPFAVGLIPIFITDIVYLPVIIVVVEVLRKYGRTLRRYL
jgi:hypothetical protein